MPRTLVYARGHLFMLENRGEGHSKGVHVVPCKPAILARPPGEQVLDIQDLIKSEEHTVGKPTKLRAGIPRVIDKRAVGGSQNQGKVRIYDELQAIEFLAHEYTDDSAYLQDFVPVQERRRARVFRIAWRDQMAPNGYVLECRHTPAEVKNAGGDMFAQYCASQDHGHEEIRVDKLNPSALRHASVVAQEAFRLTQNMFAIRLSQLVVDVVKNDRGQYVFLQVKAFTIHHCAPAYTPAESPLALADEDDEPHEVVKKKVPVLEVRCGMCGVAQPKSRLAKRMTARMMLETQHHLLKRGADVSFIDLRRPGMEKLTAAAAVCDLCWSLYRADHELLEVEAALAPVLGIHLPKNRGFSFPGVLDRVPPTTNPAGAGEMPEEAEAKHSHAARRGGEALARREGLVVRPVPAVVHEWRLMIYFHGFEDVPREILEISKTRPLHLWFSLFGVEHAFQLPLLTKSSYVPFEKPFLTYIFSEEARLRDVFNAFFDIRVREGYCQPRRSADPVNQIGDIVSVGKDYPEPIDVATGNLNLNPLADRDEYIDQNRVHLFMKARGDDGDDESGRLRVGSAQTESRRYRGWFPIQLTVGLTRDGMSRTEYIELQRHDDAFLAKNPYFNCAPLPDEWIRRMRDPTHGRWENEVHPDLRAAEVAHSMHLRHEGLAAAPHNPKLLALDRGQLVYNPPAIDVGLGALPVFVPS